VFNWTQGCWEFDLDEKTGWAQLPNLISGVGRPLLSLNEGRAKLNLAPKSGGDDVITPLNVALGTKPSVGVMGPQDPNKPPQDGSYRTSQGPTPVSASNPDRGYLGRTPNDTAYLQGASVDELEVKKQPRMPSYQSRSQRDMTVQRRNVTRFETALGRYFTELEPKLKAAHPQRKANGRKAAVSWDKWTTELSNLLFRIVREVIGAEGRRYAQRFGGTFDLSKTLNYRTAMAEGSADQILQSVRQEIDDLGVDTALSRTPQHAASAGGSLGVRSTTWARREAARQSPQPDHRFQETWVKDTDRHASLDGTSVALDGVWPGGLKTGSAPGCRCTATII